MCPGIPNPEERVKSEISESVGAPDSAPEIQSSEDEKTFGALGTIGTIVLANKLPLLLNRPQTQTTIIVPTTPTQTSTVVVVPPNPPVTTTVVVQPPGPPRSTSNYLSFFGIFNNVFFVDRLWHHKLYQPNSLLPI
jgi:hypothetical protein